MNPKSAPSPSIGNQARATNVEETMVRRLVALAVLALPLTGSVLAVTAMPAAASCAAAPTIAGDLQRADLVFVGTVTQLTNDERWATFQVEDLWKGDPGAPQVEVRAGPGNPGGDIKAGSSVDRTFDAGARYLVFAYDPGAHGYVRMWGEDSRFEDNICSATTLYAPTFDQFRPGTARRVESVPSGSTTTSASIAPSSESSYGDIPRNIALAVGAVAVMAVAGAARSFARRSRAARPETISIG